MSARALPPSLFMTFMPFIASVLMCMSLGACPGGQTSSESSGSSNTADPTSNTSPTSTTVTPTTTAADGNLPPVPVISANLGTDLAAPLALTLKSESTDPDGKISKTEWDLGDGALASGETAQHVFTREGKVEVKLTVVDDDGAGAQASKLIEVGGCPKFQAGASQGALKAPTLVEASGLAASRRSPGVLWSHNDTDDDPTLYTFTLAGAPLGVYTLQGAKLRDWEDMALGPGPKQGTDYLYVGDIGDNEEQYASIVVYRVAEPPVDPRATNVVASLSGVEALEFTYPNGAPHNSETLIVDPVLGDLYTVGKSGDGTSEVFHAAAPLKSGALTSVHTINFGPGGLTTGGSASAAGDRVLVRTYFGARMWHRSAGTPLWQAFTGPACEVPVVMELQGEAISFAGAGIDYLTTSEGEMPPLYRYVRG